MQSLQGKNFTALLCFCFPIAEQPQGLSVADSSKVKALSPRAGGDLRLGRKEGHAKGPCAIYHQQ